MRPICLAVLTALAALGVNAAGTCELLEEVETAAAGTIDAYQIDPRLECVTAACKAERNKLRRTLTEAIPRTRGYIPTYHELDPACGTNAHGAAVRAVEVMEALQEELGPLEGY